MKCDEFDRSVGALTVHFREWATGAARAGIGVLHGLGEHSGRYGSLAELLVAAGFGVIAVDMPGHGKTVGKRGHVDGPHVWDAVVDELRERLAARFPDRPLILFGHSFGGAVTLWQSLRRPDGWTAVIANGAALELAFEPPRWKTALADGIGRVFPRLAMANELDPKTLSTDPAIVQAYIDDPLVHHWITARMFATWREVSTYVLEHASECRLPTLVMHGTADALISPSGTTKFAERAGSPCERKLWEGFYHEVHNEPRKGEVADFMVNWIGSRIAPPDAGQH